jgi:hypothetical protein
MCGNDCKAKKSISPKQAAGMWSGLLLFLIPKCPFCFMAFSSVLVFCGENGTGHSTRNFYSATTLILTAIFCATALLSIILYYRPERGKYALLLAVPGMITLIFSVTAGGGISLYYTGALLVLAGLLRNSGLWSLWMKWFFTKKTAY